MNGYVVSQHAEEAAFLWTTRNRAVGEPHYTLDDLAALDERVEAHLDGVRVSGDVGWTYCKKNLDNQGPGELFALSVVAFGAGERVRMTEALTVGGASAKAASGLVSALGWLDLDAVLPWISRLLEARAPSSRAVAIRACATHRHDPGSMLASAIGDPDLHLRSSALRAVGELKRHDLGNVVHAQLRADDEAARFWAAWALTLLGDARGVPAMTHWFGRYDAFGRRALSLALRAMRLEDSREWIRSLANDPKLRTSAVVGAGAAGDPAAIPWLIRNMESPAFARLAGEAFTTITGVDLAYKDLNQDPPVTAQAGDASIYEVLDLDYESNLAWPSPERVAEWWEQNSSSFSQGVRYLGGKPIGPQTVIEVLLQGKQRQRAAAALELALQRPEQILFEVRGRGGRQQRNLARWAA